MDLNNRKMNIIHPLPLTATRAVWRQSSILSHELTKVDCAILSDLRDTCRALSGWMETRSRSTYC